MEKQILEELKEPKAAIVQLTGTSNPPKAEQLSATALDKAAKEFQKQKKSDQWLSEHELYKYCEDAHWHWQIYTRRVLQPFRIFSRSCFGQAKNN